MSGYGLDSGKRNQKVSGLMLFAKEPGAMIVCFVELGIQVENLGVRVLGGKPYHVI